MSDCLDLRIQKTYMALTNSFMALLGEKNFEDITVNEICEKAMIRRATFYKHFGDKSELLTFIIKEQLGVFKAKCLDDKISRFSEDYYLHIFSLILDYIDDNLLLMKTVKNSRLFPIISSSITEELLLMMKEAFKQDSAMGKDFLLPYEIIAQAYVGIIMSIGSYWVNKSEHISKEELLSQFRVLAQRLYSTQ